MLSFVFVLARSINVSAETPSDLQLWPMITPYKIIVEGFIERVISVLTHIYGLGEYRRQYYIWDPAWHGFGPEGETIPTLTPVSVIYGVL